MTLIVGGNSTDGIWLTQTIAILTAVLDIPVSQGGADLCGRNVFLVYLTGFGDIGSIIVAKASSMHMAIAGFATTGIPYEAQPLLLAVTSEL
ncbi:siderophore iron transporter [Fusarium acutatum]|uniref:Siderophore iron transporter n=1 Tax=Fusarium acutatum TaxID=78861 RepID=A0A8H4NBU8_9HYPO|nr:siderophore iron transporter [Fusarium acutatum]